MLFYPVPLIANNEQYDSPKKFLELYVNVPRTMSILPDDGDLGTEGTTSRPGSDEIEVNPITVIVFLEGLFA